MTRHLLQLFVVLAMGWHVSPAVSAEPDADPVFIIVRHAEKADDDKRDPSLSEAGNQRAAALAERLSGLPLQAVYATPFRRTRQTAAPSAEQHGLTVQDYDPRQPPTELAAHLRQAHPHGTILLVGHSNTVPNITAALSGETIPEMSEAEYGLIYVVRPDAEGELRLVMQEY